MTTAPTVYQSHPLAAPLRAGDVTWTWCSAEKCMVRTPHVWTGHKLICLECHPECRPEKDGEG